MCRKCLFLHFISELTVVYKIKSKLFLWQLKGIDYQIAKEKKLTLQKNIKSLSCQPNTTSKNFLIVSNTSFWEFFLFLYRPEKYKTI